MGAFGQAADWVRDLEGVKEARLDIMNGLTLVTDWVDGEIRKRAFARRDTR